MPRRARISTGGLAYHILNRRVGRLGLFDKPADYMAFEKILNEANERTAIRIAAYCLMPNQSGMGGPYRQTVEPRVDAASAW